MLFEVRLLTLPVDTWAHMAAHHETVRRELGIIQDQTTDLPRVDLYARALEAGLSGLSEHLTEELRDAVHEGLVEKDVIVKVQGSAAAEAASMIELFDEIDDFCRTHLLSVETPSELMMFRRWLLGEFVSQVESDAPPMPWNRFQFAIDDAPPRTETGNGPEETIRFSGELDLASAADLQAAIQEARHHGTSWLKLDLREVTFIDSVGLSLLVTAYNRLTEEGGRLHLEMSARLRPLLDLSGLLEILDVSFHDPS